MFSLCSRTFAALALLPVTTGSRWFSSSGAFSAAQLRVKQLPQVPSDDEKLRLYALFKQSTVGPNTTPKPSMLDFVGGAKWSAWAKLGSLPRAEAEVHYVAFVESLERGGAPAPSAAVSGADSGARPAPPVTTLKLTHHGPHVVEVALHRPQKLNAMSAAMFAELLATFQRLHRTPSVRCILLTGGEESRAFTSGLDLGDHASLLSPAGASEHDDPARQAFKVRRLVEDYQAALTAVAAVRAPVIAAIHGACIGGGVDLICATDVRLASQDAMLKVAENKIGLCPDLGTLQRLPRLVGSDSWVREVCLTARDIGSEEALARGLVSALYKDAAALREGALLMAASISRLSPVAVLGCKANLNFSREHSSTSSALAFQASWSSGALLTQDIAQAVMKKDGAVFKEVPA